MQFGLSVCGKKKSLFRMPTQLPIKVFVFDEKDTIKPLPFATVIICSWLWCLVIVWGSSSSGACLSW